MSKLTLIHFWIWKHCEIWNITCVRFWKMQKIKRRIPKIINLQIHSDSIRRTSKWSQNLPLQH
jgi:hypothetical protein